MTIKTGSLSRHQHRCNLELSRWTTRVPNRPLENRMVKVPILEL